MEKPAETQYAIHDLLRRRWSQRAMDERPVPPETVASLFEAARWAPSSNNAQPWRFIVTSKEEKADYDRLLHCLVEGNSKWAFRAPLLILSVAKLTFEDGSPNRHALHDVGLATENLVLQATALGLTTHQMAGFSAEQARETFKIPSGYEPVAIIAVGYPGDPSILPEFLRERELKPRTRDASATFVYSGEWGRTSPLAG
jgi:nitroreductase